MKQKVPTILVGPQTLSREGLAVLLSKSGYKLVRSIPCVDDLVHGPSLAAGARLFIVSSRACAKATDWQTPLPEMVTLKALYPDARLVVLSDAFDTKDAVAALNAGADGYIMDTMTSEALIKSLDLVMCGETVVASEFARAIAEQASPKAQMTTAAAPMDTALGGERIALPPRQERTGDVHKLSGREASILSCLKQGESNKLISRNVGISEATVKTHIKAILRKINVKNRTQAALWAVNHLQPEMEAS